MKFKTYSQCCHDVAVKHGLGTTLVTGHKATYFTEAHQLFINQFTPSQREAMALEKFPVAYEMGKLGIEHDSNELTRYIYLSALTDLAKLMGGEEG